MDGGERIWTEVIAVDSGTSRQHNDSALYCNLVLYQHLKKIIRFIIFFIILAIYKSNPWTYIMDIFIHIPLDHFLHDRNLRKQLLSYYFRLNNLDIILSKQGVAV